MRYLVRLAVLAGVVALWAGQANAQTLNAGPPAAPSDGQVILDLSGTAATLQIYNANGTCGSSESNGTAIANCNPVTYTGTFTTPGGISASTITFAFRNDPGYFGLSNVTLTPTGGSNVLVDGNFANPNQVLNSLSSQANITSSACTGYAWCGYNQVPGIASGSLVAANEPGYSDSSGLQLSGGSSWFWVDGATGEYDGIYQTVTLQPDATYTLSFDLQNITSNNSTNSPVGNATGIQDGCGGVADYTNYSSSATNTDALNANSMSGTCGNGVDVVAYVGYPDLPTPSNGFGTPAASAPEPASLVLMGSGLLGLGLLRRYRRS